MALPRTLPSAYVFPDPSTTISRVPPLFANSAVYIVGLRDDGTNTKLAIWRSADPDASAFTIQDTGNEPTLDTSYILFESQLFSVSAWLDGGIIHIAVASDLAVRAVDNALSYFRFDTSADTWSTSHGAWGSILATYGGDGPPRAPHCDIRVHTVTATEYIQICYAAAVETVHGTDRDRVSIATFDGSSWTADRVFDNSASTATVDYFFCGLCKPIGVERVHGMVLEFGATWNVNTISTSDGISLANDTVANTVQSYGNGVSFDDGTVRCRISQKTGAAPGYVFEFDDAVTVSTLTTNARLGETIDQARDFLSMDGTDEYWFYVGGGNDIWYDLNDSTDIEWIDAKTFLNLYGTPQSYTVAGRNVIGYLTEELTDGDEYDEFVLDAASTTRPRIIALNRAVHRASFH